VVWVFKGYFGDVGDAIEVELVSVLEVALVESALGIGAGAVAEFFLLFRRLIPAEHPEGALQYLVCQVNGGIAYLFQLFFA
jgi:hypothetical protein